MQTQNAQPTACLTSEAARILQVNENTVRAWADSGRLTAQRTVTGLRVFSREEVQRVAAERAAARKKP